MHSCWMMLNSQLVWTWKTTSMTEYLWTIIGLRATGWFLSTLRRA
jgi:hypothetical protein